MDFDKFFPIIIMVIIWGIGRAIRNSPKDDQEDSSPVKQGTGLFSLLQQGLAALEEQSRRDEILDGDAYIQPVSVTEPGEIEDSLIDMADHAAVSSSWEVDSLSPPPEVVSPQPVATIQKRHSKAGARRRKLRNAVVWAEILAPPVALRD